MSLIELLRQPWHWAFSGTMIALVMGILLFCGKSFGVSSTLRATCSMAGAGKKIGFFNYDWRCQKWNLIFALGAIIGGFIAANYLSASTAVDIAPNTLEYLQALGIQQSSDYAKSLLPEELFSFESLMTFKGFMLMVVGGFCVGFGARYAGGCTSGHAISGLSNLQLPSFIAVIGFFIGGLLMTHLLLPLIMKF